MKQPPMSVTRTLLVGVLIVVPLYLATLLLLKAANSVVGLVRPIAAVFPDWVPADTALALLLVLLVCFLVGLSVRTPAGQAGRDKIEQTFFSRVPGYAIIRNLTHRMAGETHGNVWRPALFHNAGALVMAFIIEEFPDGRYTVFVPSIPAPFSGAVYIVEPSRVHPLDVPFTDAIRSVSRWGEGASDLVAAMERKEGIQSSGSGPGPGAGD